MFLVEGHVIMYKHKGQAKRKVLRSPWLKKNLKKCHQPPATYLIFPTPTADKVPDCLASWEPARQGLVDEAILEYLRHVTWEYQNDTLLDHRESRVVMKKINPSSRMGSAAKKQIKKEQNRFHGLHRFDPRTHIHPTPQGASSASSAASRDALWLFRVLGVGQASIAVLCPGTYGNTWKNEKTLGKHWEKHGKNKKNIWLWFKTDLGYLLEHATLLWSFLKALWMFTGLYTGVLTHDQMTRSGLDRAFRRPRSCLIFWRTSAVLSVFECCIWCTYPQSTKVQLQGIMQRG